MIKDIQEINFPEYATLSTATVSLSDMGEKTITAQIKIDGAIVPDFSYDWEVEFRGERYIQPLRQPQASKGNDSIASVIDLTFYHWAIYDMKRNYFVEMASTESGTPIVDKYNASLSLNLGEFCVAFQQVLDYYYNGAIVIDLNPDYEYSQDNVFVSIDYSYIWDVLQSLYENYGARWELTTIDGVCYIKIGYPTKELSHIFEYGFEGGLLKIERQVQDVEIRNRLLGRGGERNLPTYYFKNAPEDSTFTSDPDAIPELENIYFNELRGKTFRDYVKGWKAQHYGGETMSEPTEAYTKGYIDEKFNPIEYVDDSASIEKYGLLVGALENVEDIHPSIQDVTIEPYGRIDEVVAVSEVTNDDIEQSVENNVVVSDLDGTSFTWHNVEQGGVRTTKMYGPIFGVAEGSVANIDGVFTTRGTLQNSSRPTTYDPDLLYIQTISTNIQAINIETNEIVPSVGIPAGNYRYVAEIEIKNQTDYILKRATASFTEVKLVTASENENAWKPTFDIWVKNLWGTTKNNEESEEEYTNRVWTPILGTTEGEATVCFGSGWLAVSDYEFVISKVSYDTSKSYNGVASEWKITLYKTDAEYEATGKYLPNSTTNGNAIAGDYFYFTNIELPHQYVLWAEEKLDERKRSELTLNANVNPTWVVNFDKVRLNTLLDSDNGTLLFEQLEVGAMLNTADVRFLPDVDYLSLYITSMTYQYGNSLLPDVEVVLSDKQIVTLSPLTKIQGEIDGVYKQLGVLATAETAEVAVTDIVRKVGGKLFLRKDGVEDSSLSETTFANLVKSEGFVQGLVGGSGWGIYRDENGNTIIEADKINARQELSANNFVAHQVSIIGGTQVISSASMECSKVIELEDGYQCFFEQRSGSVVNQFVVNDIAYSQEYEPNGQSIRYYKRIVTEIGDDYIILSKTEKDGDSVPMEGDVIAQFGNTIDTSRQGIIIFSTYGEDAPSIKQYANVDSFSLEGKQVTKFSNGENVVTGKMTILPNSEGAANLTDLEVGGSNLLRNAGFLGDYTSRELSSEELLDVDDAMWSEPLKYWNYNDVIVENSDVAISGKQANIQGRLIQVFESPLSANENYVFSFNGIGSIRYVMGDSIDHTIELDGTSRYSEVVKPTSEVLALVITGPCSIWDIQLERGIVATSWKVSPLDNNKELAEMQSMHYLQRAITEGNTEIEGGLVLTNIVKVGEHEDGAFKRETGGMSGYWSEDNDVAFWAGGSMSQAIKTAQAYKYNANQQPTKEELAEMAKFVVTHGGRAILNDIILRGYVYAEGGVFSGFVKRTPTIINADNYNQYMAVYESNDEDSWYDLDLEKAGSFIIFEGDLPVAPHFYLPLLYYSTTQGYVVLPTSKTMYDVMGMVGQQVIIINNSNAVIHICSSNGCHGIPNGDTAIYECIMVTVNDEIVGTKWKIDWDRVQYETPVVGNTQ